MMLLASRKSSSSSSSILSRACWRALYEFTCFRVILEHFVVEHGEVESDTELNRVAGGKVDSVSLLISLLGLLLDLLKKIVLGVLGNVAVVISYHLDEECLGLLRAVGVKDAVVDHID